MRDRRGKFFCCASGKLTGRVDVCAISAPINRALDLLQRSPPDSIVLCQTGGELTGAEIEIRQRFRAGAGGSVVFLVCYAAFFARRYPTLSNQVSGGTASGGISSRNAV